MAYTINGNIPCGTEACTGREHTPAGACNSVYDIILDAIKEVKGEVANVDSLAKEATLLAKVAELKEALNTIDFTAIEQAIQDVEDVTAKEATLIQGISSVAKQGENQEATNSKILEGINSIANSMVTSLQEKVVTPQKYVQEVTPDNDKLGLKKVVVMGYTPEVISADPNEFEIQEDFKINLTKIAAENIRGEYECLVACAFYNDVKDVYLSTADAYYTCDGHFYDYSTQHTFAETNDPQRWVIFYYKTNGNQFAIGELQPYEISVIGNLGSILITKDGNIERILVPDGSSIEYVDNVGYAQKFRSHTMKNILKHNQNALIFNNDNYGSGILDIGIKELNGGYVIQNNVGNFSVVVFSELVKATSGYAFYNYNRRESSPVLKEVHFPKLEECSTCLFGGVNYWYEGLSSITFPSLKKSSSVLFSFDPISKKSSLRYLEFPAMEEISSIVFDKKSGTIGDVVVRFPNLKEYNTTTETHSTVHTEAPEVERMIFFQLGETYITSTSLIQKQTDYFPKLRYIDTSQLWQYSGLASYSKDIFNDFPNLEEAYLGCWECWLLNGTYREVHFPKLRILAYKNHFEPNASPGYRACLFYTKQTMELFSLDSIEEIKDLNVSYNASRKVDIARIYIGCQGDRMQTVNLNAGVADTYTKDIEIGVGARQPISIVNYNGLTAENIALHILDKLADNTDGETITIKIGATNLATINADATYSQYVALAQAKNYTII